MQFWKANTCSRSLKFFMGIGSLAPYIRNTVVKILEKTNGESAYVVSTNISKDWDEVIPAKDSRYSISAEQFLDDILRAITSDGFSKVLTLIDKVKDSSPVTGIDVASSTQSTLEFLSKFPAHTIWLWVRRGLLPQGYGSAVVDALFQKCIVALALINSISTLREIETVGSVVSIKSDHFIVELALAKQLTWSDELSKTKIANLRTDKRANLLPHADRVLILSYNHIGPLPPEEMPRDLVDTREGIIYGPDIINDRWVGLDELLQVKSKEDLNSLLGVIA